MNQSIRASLMPGRRLPNGQVRVPIEFLYPTAYIDRTEAIEAEPGGATSGVMTARAGARGARPIPLRNGCPSSQRGACVCASVASSQKVKRTTHDERCA
jgi:hypothetical protein